MSERTLIALPTPTERHCVDEVLEEALSREYSEVVVLGFKGGKSYLQCSTIDDIGKTVGDIEWVKYRLMQRGEV